MFGSSNLKGNVRSPSTSLVGCGKIHLWTLILPRLLVVSLHYVFWRPGGQGLSYLTPWAVWVSHIGGTFRFNSLSLSLYWYVQANFSLNEINLDNLDAIGIIASLSTPILTGNSQVFAKNSNILIPLYLCNLMGKPFQT